MKRLGFQNKSDRLYWLVGIVFAAACGYVHVRLRDSSLSVLMVTGFTMFLAYKRPERVWRWALVVGLGMPAAALFALITRDHPSRGLIAGSFAGLAFSVVAAGGGKFLHRARTELFPKKVDGGR
jgi:Na+/proline symporter